jgi:predicted amidophosphoribosyltransferase
MATFEPRRILGKWREGFALDLHTIRSVFIGDDEFGHPRFDTQRTELGELLYRLKNTADLTVVVEIVDAVEHFCESWKRGFELIVPVPPSSRRAVQPVLVLAKAMSERLGVPVIVCVTRKRDVPELKNVFDLDERARLLEGLHSVDTAAVEGRSVLLFDDLFRSGAAMNAITGELYDSGKASDVFALTITRTRSHR